MTNEEILDQDFLDDSETMHYTLANIKKLMNQARKDERDRVIEEIIDIIINMEWDVMQNTINGQKLLYKLNSLKGDGKCTNLS